MSDISILGRRYLPGGREDLVFERGGERRLGRVFPCSIEPGFVERWLAETRSTGIPGVAVPDSAESSGTGRVLLSLPAGGMEYPAPSPPPLSTVLEALGAIHSAGLLHLDLASAPFAVDSGRHVLLLWGDAVLARDMPFHAPEIAAGAFPGPEADWFQLGRLLGSPRSPAAGDEALEHASMLCDPSPSVREEAAARLGMSTGQGRRPRPQAKLPRRGLTLLCGGSWRDRDRQVNEWVCAASSRGWPTRVVRCSGAERTRPLPDRPPGGPRVGGAGDLLREIFPGSSGVTRLLVVDSFESASRDLAATVRELAEVEPPHLALVVSCPTAPAGFERLAASRIDHPGMPGPGEDLPFRSGAGGWPGPSWYGARMRTDPGPPPADPLPPMDPEAVFAEGGSRETVAAWEVGALGGGHAGIATSAYIELGMPEQALAAAPPDACQARASALSMLGRHSEAEMLLRQAGAPSATGEAALLLAEALIPQGRLEEALALLQEHGSTDTAGRQAGILDLLGRPMDALDRVDEALPRASGRPRIDLLCTRCTLLMRLGAYRDALATADSAVVESRTAGDLLPLALALQERGRVREVTGMWRESLEDYRTAALYFSETGTRRVRPPQVDLFVLESRMGLLRDAADTFEAITRIMGPGPSRADSMLLDLLRASEGSILCRGADALQFAERGAAAAAGLGMQLRQGLCLLYRGRLLLQEGDIGEAVLSIRHAAAIAGLLGDRHLSLLADLALAQAGLASDPSGISARARELGLRSEELEARALTTDGARSAEALSQLLELPSPVRACEIAVSTGAGLPPELLRRLSAARARILEQMSREDAVRFSELTAVLAAPPAEAADETAGSLPGAISLIAGWLPAYCSGEEGLEALEKSVFAGHPAHDATGAGEASPVEALRRLVASIVEACPVRQPAPAGSGDGLPGILGVSPVMEELRGSIRRAAALDLPVLVEGETGTGKDLVASALHRLGRRSQGALVPVDCGAIPDSLLEAELFGAGRGAWTDLRADRTGLLEAAAGGTLFLDEVGNLPLLLQAKLLRALESGRIRRLGETVEREVDFRLITASNSDLSRETAAGRFRSDLYYRIAVIVLRIPPLRERIPDIPLLASHFAGQAARENGEAPAFSRGAVRKLASHPWPGNVRELRNVVQRAVMLSGGGPVHESHVVLDPQAGAGSTGPVPMESIDTVVAGHVHRVVEALGGTRARAAEILGCDPKTLRKYLRLYSQRLERKGESRT